MMHNHLECRRMKGSDKTTRQGDKTRTPNNPADSNEDARFKRGV